jgi:P27 family predicted phage terminase small subunit
MGQKGPISETGRNALKGKPLGESRHPVPTRDLSANECAIWRRTCQVLDSRGMLHTVTVDTLDHYVAVRDRWERLRDEQQTTPFMCQDAKDRQHPHPIHRQFDTVGAELRMIEKALGMSPEALARLGAAPGDVDDDDGLKLGKK